ncbi:MAG: YihY/virulence factor BrkB family protein [Gemmatimonadota bacterium]|nr:YihY/virulence factor BrkB family protein [Gemmatimonadota bacterium]MDH4349318.1 YihY/virulence factor BrkB family protein [Gemmatimonadota bacterium]MDH5284900.1 YihY/virulence factor BrkB family protein [Gemmatimonadota bacterium]
MRDQPRGLAGFSSRVLNQADRHNLPFLASALTFDALLAAIPFLILLLVGLTMVARLSPVSSSSDLDVLFQRFLPEQAGPVAGVNPLVERALLAIARARATISLYAIPLFLWFATRLFASIRASLTLVYDVPRRAAGRHFIVAYLAGKARDGVMVLLTVAILTINGFLTTGLHIVELVRARLQQAVPGFGFLATGLGHLLSEMLAFAFAVAMFYVVYRHASPRKLRRRAAVVGSVFTAVLVEFAKRLYGWYLSHLAMTSQFSTDAQLGALVLFVLWVYYAALVFLLGAVVAETWELWWRLRTHGMPPHPLATAE